MMYFLRKTQSDEFLGCFLPLYCKHLSEYILCLSGWKSLWEFLSKRCYTNFKFQLQKPTAEQDNNKERLTRCTATVNIQNKNAPMYVPLPKTMELPIIVEWRRQEGMYAAVNCTWHAKKFQTKDHAPIKRACGQRHDNEVKSCKVTTRRFIRLRNKPAGYSWRLFPLATAGRTFSAVPAQVAAVPSPKGVATMTDNR